MKRVLFILIMATFSGSLTSQTNLKWGISYAPSFADIANSTKMQYGQQVILQMKWNKGKRNASRLGLGYSFLRAEKNYGSNIYLNNTHFQHQDIILPFQWQYGVSYKPNRVYFVAGAMLSLNINRKAPNAFDLHYKWLDGFTTLGLGYESNLKNGAQIFIQPQFQSNLCLRIVYFLKYVLGIGNNNEYNEPPTIGIVGVELGYFLH